MNDRPLWIPTAKSASIHKWAESLHKQAKAAFLKNKGHAHILFLFKDDGLTSINPVPPKTSHEQIYNAIRKAIMDNNLYGVIHVGECWTYFPKKHDHTAFQILDGELKVADLKDEDKTEALYMRMESRDGDCVLFLDKIERKGDEVMLGDARRIEGEELKWW